MQRSKAAQDGTFSHSESRSLLQNVPSLGPDAASFPCDVQETAIAVELGLEQPPGVIEGIATRRQENGWTSLGSLGYEWQRLKQLLHAVVNVLDFVQR
jgi:hypothetical protein